jgi:integrase/recombinase XerD
MEPFLLPLFLDEIDKAKVDEIVTARRAQGVSTSTIRNDLTALSSVLKFADLDSNPALNRLQRLKARRDPIVLPDVAHIERMIGRAPGRMSALVAAAWRTGCRLEELVTAERAKLDHTHRQLTVIGKGNKLRVIDLDFGGAYEILRALPVRLGCKWLFWHGDGLPYKNLSARFGTLVRAELAAAERAAEKAGHAEPDFRKFRFHDLRHRHAVDWLKAGRSIYDLQQRLGHESVKTTEIYLKFLTPEEKRVAMYGPGAPAPDGQQQGA